MSQQVLAGQQLDIHDGSAITITSPQNGATVGSSFDLTYSFRKGVMAEPCSCLYGWNVSEGV